MRGHWTGQQREDMRDRLWELQNQTATEEQSGSASAVGSPANTFSNVDLDEIPQQAVVFEHQPPLNGVFSQAETIRREIHLIQRDVKRLREKNQRALVEVTASDTLSQESSAIAGEIKCRGEAVLVQLRGMEAHCRELEESQGSNSAVARVARAQYVCLSNSLRDTIFDYNEAEIAHRNNCKANIQKQMMVMGKEVSGEEVEEMMETGKVQVFTENVLEEGKTARAALSQIESRHREMLELEGRLRAIQELFLDLAVLVEEQTPMVNNIETNVSNTEVFLGEMIVKLNAAKKYDRKNPFKRMCCSCFPCYK